MGSPVLLVNTNVAKPPVSPVGLEYVGEALVAASHAVSILDLSFESDWKAALQRAIAGDEPLVIGMSVRNTDDCSFASRKSFLPWIAEVVSEAKRLSQALLVLGGVGFSVMPEAVLGLTKADAGIAGDGEAAMLRLVERLAKGDSVSDLPNLVHSSQGRLIHNGRQDVDLRESPLPRRRLFDNRRYEALGAMVGIETKRGCAGQCVFCADPVAKGRIVRVRPPAVVVAEFRDLLNQGVSWFHIADSEFNIPINHAKDVCHAILDAGLGEKLKWYCYCSPVPFDGELAALMKRAGCYGINFGVDSLCDEQLLRLGRIYLTRDIEQLIGLLGREGLNYMFDFLVGGPGETRDTTMQTINKTKDLGVPLAGIALGVRVYAGTPFGKAVINGFGAEALHPRGERLWHDPVFYLSPDLGEDANALMSELVAGDERFLFLATASTPGNYNYADDDALAKLIAGGARGAYWDILRRRRLG